MTRSRHPLIMDNMSDTAAETVIPEITLGWRLRMAMERAGIKADRMATELDVHRGTLTRWTHDQGAAPRRLYLERWAELCSVPYEWLVGDLFSDPTAAETKLPQPRRRSTDIGNDRLGDTRRASALIAA